MAYVVSEKRAAAMAAITGDEKVKKAREFIKADHERCVKEQVTITNLRHREALEQALNSLLLVRESVGQGLPEDFFTIDLMEAYRQLGLILGEEVGEDLVNEIFSKFCMGK